MLFSAIEYRHDTARLLDDDYGVVSVDCWIDQNKDHISAEISFDRYGELIEVDLCPDDNGVLDEENWDTQEKQALGELEEFFYEHIGDRFCKELWG